jgi:hypothetical protein
LEPELPSIFDVGDIDGIGGLETIGAKLARNVDGPAALAGYGTLRRASPPGSPLGAAWSGAWMAVRGLHTCGKGRPLLHAPKIR